jgi:hypothetical protein
VDHNEFTNEVKHTYNGPRHTLMGIPVTNFSTKLMDTPYLACKHDIRYLQVSCTLLINATK